MLTFTDLSKKVGEVASAPEEIFYIQYNLFSYLSGAHANNDSSVNVVYYKPTPNRLDQMAEHEVVKERDEETLKEDRREDLHLSVKFEHHRPAFSDMLTDFHVGPTSRTYKRFKAPH